MSAQRKNIMLGTAGHVDHGKTALVKLLTGCDTDRLAAEKERGLTIELGFAPCKMRDERIVGIVDVPGHADFIHNMVAGAHGVDLVILVIAADDGVMPQTREHLDILTLMGTKQGLVALTKIDLVDSDTAALAVQEIDAFVKGTFLEGAAICPISNITGEGFDGFFDALNQTIDKCAQREERGLFRMWAEHAFAVRGFGTVVTGIPTSGAVCPDEKLEVLPGARIARVRRLEVYGQEAQIGRAGECVAVNLIDVDPQDIPRGTVLAEPGAFEPVSMVEGELRLLDSASGSLKDRAEVHVYVGTAEVMAKAALLGEQTVLGPGQTTMVQLRLTNPLGIVPSDRFIIRAGLGGAGGGRVSTIGGGRILSTTNKRLRRNRPWTLQQLKFRSEAIDSPLQWCALNLREAGEPLGAEALGRRARMDTEQAVELLGDLPSDQAIQMSDGRFVHRQVVADAARRIKDQLRSFHDSQPTRLGIAPGELAGEIGLDEQLFDLAVGQLASEGAIERREPVISLAGRGVQLSGEDQQLCDQIEQALRNAHLAAPSVRELTESLGASPDRICEMIRLLADKAQVVQLNEKLALHACAVEAARQVAMELFAAKESFTTMKFRDALGVSRKYAVPLLDYFDTIRLTVRSASKRTPGAAAKQKLQGDNDTA